MFVWWRHLTATNPYEKVAARYIHNLHYFSAGYEVLGQKSRFLERPAVLGQELVAAVRAVGYQLSFCFSFAHFGIQPHPRQPSHPLPSHASCVSCRQQSKSACKCDMYSNAIAF